MMGDGWEDYEFGEEGKRGAKGREGERKEAWEAGEGVKERAGGEDGWKAEARGENGEGCHERVLKRGSGGTDDGMGWM